jgi:hypothetical protein
MRFHPHLIGRLLAASFWLTGGAAEFDQRMTNLSTRTLVEGEAIAPVIGFAIGPGEPKTILIRAVGPTLARFGVAGVLSDPRLEVFDGNGRQILGNDNWSPESVGGTATFSTLGAFPLAVGTRDAAFTATLAPGSYTTRVSGVANSSGVALVEVYDVTGEARLMNLSARAHVGIREDILIAGLVLGPGGGARKILVRAAGPVLAGFGVADAIRDPAIAILNGANVDVASNNNWSAGNAAAMAAAFAQAGAFPFPAGSKDAATLADLAPGQSYSIQVRGVEGESGQALVEIYDLTARDIPTVSVSSLNASTDNRGAPPGLWLFPGRAQLRHL